MSTTASTMDEPPSYSARNNKLQKKRNSTWFKRKSGFFTVNEATGGLDVVAEDPSEAKKASLMLPEVNKLGGGRLNDGAIGWDDGMFRD